MREERDVCSAQELDKRNDCYVVIQAFNTSIFVAHGLHAFSRSVRYYCRFVVKVVFAARAPAM
jgi:hypothetical protein